MAPPSSMLIAFYDGSGFDARGRSLGHILSWGADKLESSHNYIQTLFPLPEESMFNDAPLIDEEIFNAFRERGTLRDRLRDAFKKMLWFYGFRMIEINGKITVHRMTTFHNFISS